MQNAANHVAFQKKNFPTVASRDPLQYSKGREVKVSNRWKLDGRGQRGGTCPSLRWLRHCKLSPNQQCRSTEGRARKKGQRRAGVICSGVNSDPSWLIIRPLMASRYIDQYPDLGTGTSTTLIEAGISWRRELVISVSWNIGLYGARVTR